MSQPQANQPLQPNPELREKQAVAQEGFESNMLPPSEITLPPQTTKAVTLNMDDIKANSILVINIDVENPIQKMAVAPVFSKLLAPYAAKLREKGVTVMLMTLNETINTITEEEMNAAGWEKKAKSLIIKPFGN